MGEGKSSETEEKEDEVYYEATFELPTEFGKVGAVLVENEHHNEMFLKSIVFDGFPDGPVHLTCDSWVQPKYDNPVKRVFFTDKVSVTKCHFKINLVSFMLKKCSILLIKTSSI